jgi:hypothetical protein
LIWAPSERKRKSWQTLVWQGLIDVSNFFIEPRCLFIEQLKSYSCGGPQNLFSPQKGLLSSGVAFKTNFLANLIKFKQAQIFKAHIFPFSMAFYICTIPSHSAMKLIQRSCGFIYARVFSLNNMQYNCVCMRALEARANALPRCN